MADNELDGPVLGAAWDGSGWGPDGTIWGGEFLRILGGGFERVGHLRSFRLPGGEAAIREPRRSALGVLFELFGDDLPGDLASVGAFAPGERRILISALARGVNAPVTSSAGRLFDAVASLVGLRHVSTFEGQAAMELEFALDGHASDEVYDGASEDWEAILRGILRDLRLGAAPGDVSARFHNSLAEVIVDAARRAGEERVLLTGGCFQNRYLTERAVRRLREEGFRPYWHQRVPPNDGGIALGQILALKGR
jgi:hydrogenase maturation protein HypF